MALSLIIPWQTRDSCHIGMYIRSLLSSTHFQFILFCCSLSFFPCIPSTGPLIFAAHISFGGGLDFFMRDAAAGTTITKIFVNNKQ